MPVTAATFGAINTGLGLGGAVGGVVGGTLSAIASRRQAKAAAKLVERQAEIRAYALQQEALDFLVLADYTAAQTLLDAQDAERIGRYRANVVRETGRRRRGSLRSVEAEQGTVTDDTASIMAMADDLYQTELAALAERYHGEAAGRDLRTEAEQLRYKARVGLSAARQGQDRLREAASIESSGIRSQANTQMIQTLLGNFLGPQTMRGVLPFVQDAFLQPRGPNTGPLEPADASIYPNPVPLPTSRYPLATFSGLGNE